jgi:hypothetical protein
MPLIPFHRLTGGAFVRAPFFHWNVDHRFEMGWSGARRPVELGELLNGTYCRR